jgi:type II secretory ATPase GspE/PulE/Tfp pilus assembly ATPase PilB-like protein
MGIYEVIEMDDDIKALVSKRADAAEIEAAAIKKGVLTMLQDGFIKSAEGLTTIEEVLRVTQE